MKKKWIIIVCSAIPAAAVAALLYRRLHRKYSVQ